MPDLKRFEISYPDSTVTTIVRAERYETDGQAVMFVVTRDGKPSVVYQIPNNGSFIRETAE